MHGYCLSEPGTFGGCRYGYLKESSKLKTATTTSLPIQVGTAVTKMHRPIRIPSVTADILIPESTPATPVLPKDVINHLLPKDTYTPGPTESASKKILMMTNTFRKLMMKKTALKYMILCSVTMEF